jgi:hypothetical protein
VNSEEAEKASRIVKTFLNVALKEEADDGTLKKRATQEEVRRYELAARMRPGGVEWDYKGKPLQVLISAAYNGDPWAHEALREIGDRLTKQGNPWPLPLQEYILNPFKRGKGRIPGKDWLEDRMIVGAVLNLEEFKPFLGNPTSEGPSVCSIVSEVLKEFGIIRSKEAIAKIVEKHRKEPYATNSSPPKTRK